MNPPPRRPDDEQPPPLPPEGATRPTDSLTPPPLPSAPPPDADPLLSDPLFAELVEGSSPPEPRATPAARPPASGANDSDLPIAEPVRAVPMTPARRPEPATPFTRRAVPAEPEHRTSRKGPLAACGVIGCFGIALLGSIGFLVYAAVVLLGHLGDQIADADRSHHGSGVVWARPGPVAPPPGRFESSIRLDGPCDAVGRGASGRYLFLRIPSKKALAVFDPNTARVIHTLPLADPKSLFAGSAAKLFLYSPSTKTIERYDLITWAKDASATVNPPLADVDAIAVGAGSDGPVYLCNTSAERAAEVRVLDADTLSQIDDHQVQEWRTRAGVPVHVRASEDGTLLGVSGASGALALRFEATGRYRAIALRGEASNPALATPSSDGKYLYTPHGVYTRDGTRTGDRPKADQYLYTFPTAQGNGLYLGLDVTAAGRIENPPVLYLAGPSTNRVGQLGTTRFQPTLDAGSVGDLPPDQRIHLWPAARLMAVLPAENDRIELQKIEPATRLRFSGMDFLVIGSDPPKTVAPNVVWRYKPEVWSPSQNVVQWEILSPQGMAFHGGEFVWMPPRGTDSFDVHVRAITIARPGQQRPAPVVAEQKFRVVVVGEHGHDE